MGKQYLGCCTNKFKQYRNKVMSIPQGASLGFPLKTISKIFISLDYTDLDLLIKNSSIDSHIWIFSLKGNHMQSSYRMSNVVNFEH